MALFRQGPYCAEFFLEVNVFSKMIFSFLCYNFCKTGQFTLESHDCFKPEKCKAVPKDMLPC